MNFNIISKINFLLKPKCPLSKVEEVTAFAKTHVNKNLRSSIDLKGREIFHIQSNLEPISDEEITNFISGVLTGAFTSERERNAFFTLNDAKKQKIVALLKNQQISPHELNQEIKNTLRILEYDESTSLGIAHKVSSFKDCANFTKQTPEPLFNTEFYLKEIREMYGEKKVKLVLNRYKNSIDPHNPIISESHIGKIQLALNSITEEELQDFLNSILTLHFESKRTHLAFANLGSTIKNQIKELGQDHLPVSKLPAPIFNALLSAFKRPLPEFKKTRMLKKINIGSKQNPIQYGSLTPTKKRMREDEERASLYQELESLDNWLCYNEILAKLLVKKQFYHEEAEELLLGIYLPAPSKDGEARWYKVDSIIDSKTGKCAYHLIAATKDYKDLPDIILYTSSLLAHHGLTIQPPAYASYEKEQEKELKWLKTSSETQDGSMRPLLIIGHSLGGSYAQMAMINFQRHLQKTGDLLPRTIELCIFDSPAIKASDVRNFAKWIHSQEEGKKKAFFTHLVFNYYVSEGDPVPNIGFLFGSSYLGKIKNKDIAHVHELSLTEQGAKNSALNGFGTHTRVFFRGKTGDYIMNTLTIKQYDKKKTVPRLCVNTARALTSLILWTTLELFKKTRGLFLKKIHTNKK